MPSTTHIGASWFLLHLCDLQASHGTYQMTAVRYVGHSSRTTTYIFKFYYMATLYIYGESETDMIATFKKDTKWAFLNTQETGDNNKRERSPGNCKNDHHRLSTTDSMALVTIRPIKDILHNQMTRD